MASVIPAVVGDIADDPHGVADAAQDAADMHAWVGGDARAFDALHARHRTRLWRFVRRGVGDEDVARELYQDVWMRVVDARDGWRPDGRFVGWLFAIARYRMIDHARAERRRPGGGAGAESGEPTDVDALAAGESGTVATLQRPLSPEELAGLAADGARVDRELARLPAAQREALLLRHVAGLSLAEIAAATLQKPEAVKSRLRQGVNRLRERLRSSP